MQDNHNEQLARYLERTWPIRLSEFCSALRRHPLPVTSGAAATVLRGVTTDALLAVDAYCCDTQNNSRESPEFDEFDAELFQMPNGTRVEKTCRMISHSPFRCFKMQCLEASASMLRRQTMQYRRMTVSEEDGNDDIPPGLPDPSHKSRGEISADHPLMSVTRRDTHIPFDEKLKVKELRAMCTSRGLLATGNKKDLIARLCQHRLMQQANHSLKSDRHTGFPPEEHQERQLVKTAASGGVGNTVHGRFASTLEEMLGNSQRLRTPFRSSPTNHQTPPPSLETQQGRLFSTPKEFVAAFMRRKPRCSPTRGDGVTTTSGTKTSGDFNWSWCLLVDNRERIRGAHNHMIDALTKAGMETLSCTLPCGDFMFGANLPGRGLPCESTSHGREENSNSYSMSSVNNEAISAPTRQIFSIVVERKTVKDLCASIAGSRYYDQRRLLSASPFRTVIWVVEGNIEILRPDEQRRVCSSCASLSRVANFRVVRTRHLPDTIVFLRGLGETCISEMKRSETHGTPRPPMSDFAACMRHVVALRRAVEARTTFPRLLMCVRGCSSALAAQLAGKYGSLLHLWRRLKNCGRVACDADADICRLTGLQKEVYVRLTEFLLAEEYC